MAVACLPPGVEANGAGSSVCDPVVARALGKVLSEGSFADGRYLVGFSIMESFRQTCIFKRRIPTFPGRSCL
jgi:hypothetical protein